jgi:hypothetical protein
MMQIFIPVVLLRNSCILSWHLTMARAGHVLTPNRSPSKWAEAFGDALFASAVLDRLTRHAE